MWTLGSFGLTTPLALLGLLALPIIWLVVRTIPPRPLNIVFPPADLLRNLPKTEETPVQAPPWLAIVRALVLGTLIFGFAGPVLNPSKTNDTRPLLLVIDNGWTAAPIWRDISNEATNLVRQAKGEVRILFTAPQNQSGNVIDALTPERAIARIGATSPQPILADHLQAIRELKDIPKGQNIIWLSDNINRPGSASFATALKGLGDVKLQVIQSPATGIVRAEATSAGFALGFVSPPSQKSSVEVEAINARARSLALSAIETQTGTSTLELEPTLLRDVAAIRTKTPRSAGGVFLLDAFDRRARVGLIASGQDDQPLLSDAHYLEEALKPFAEITRGEGEQLAQSGLDVILMPDTGTLPPREVTALQRFIENGGILVRFAGPRLIAADVPQLLPAPLLAEARALRGALTWDNAGSVGGFDRAGPLAGLSIPSDARVNTLAVFAPSPSNETGKVAPQIWARLSDTTALVSAAPLGRGWQVLFHTTAGPAWSDVAFSGLQVAMLRRVLARANSSAIPAKAIAPTAPLRPVLLLDGYGNFRQPLSSDATIAPQNVVNARPDARHPPGIYEGGGARLILQAAGPETILQPLPILPGIPKMRPSQSQSIFLGPFMLVLGLALLVLDGVLALVLAGLAPKTFYRPSRPKASLVAVFTIMAFASAFATNGFAQVPNQTAPTLRPSPADLSLAYVKTGDDATDARAKAGLEGLSRVLSARTSVEPGGVVGVDPKSAELALYPLLYWLLPDRPIETSPEVARALDRYMKTGGVVFIDTRGGGRDANAARAITRAALRGLEAPPLEQVPEGHVLTKSFYILRGFPGRYQNAKLWVETQASASASANDGVSSLIVGDGDWASAWANASPLVQFGYDNVLARNQELAARVGVNIVLYALTGNYKADQVHFETLLKRLAPR